MIASGLPVHDSTYMDNVNPATLAMNSKPGAVEDMRTGDWIIEPKYDGIRLLFHVTADGVKAYSRQGNSNTGKVPAIEAELAANLPAGTWLDGETVAFNPDGTQDWGGAQSVLGSDAGRLMDRSRIRLVVFDLISHGGIDARQLPLRQRRQLLEAIFANWTGELVQLSPAQPATEEAHEEHLALGYEGSMIKLLSAPYASNKRSPASRKLKAVDTVDAVITGYGAAEPGSWIDQAGLIGKVCFTHYENGQAIEGKCSGMDTAMRRYITEHQDELLNTVVEVSYMTRMPGTGKLRHPQFKRLRTDKTAEECRS